MYPPKLTNRIWSLRIKRAMPRKRLASLLGQTTTSQLCRWEDGTQIPTLPNALLLGYFLDMPVEVLFKGLRENLISEARLRMGEEWNGEETAAVL